MQASRHAEVSASDREFPALTGSSGTQRARGKVGTISLGIGPIVTVSAADQASRLSGSDPEYPVLTLASCTLIARPSVRHAGRLPSYPSLPRGLAGDAEPISDLGPRVTLDAQALDRLGDGLVQLVREPGHQAQCFDVAVCDAAAVGAQDAPDELPVLIVLDAPPSPFWRQPGLVTGSPAAVRRPGRGCRATVSR